MKFDGKIIVSDIDGTFLGNREGVERNIAAIKYFQQNGGKFTFATGRIHFNISTILENYGGNICNAPAICANGACIYDFEKKNVIREVVIDPMLAIEVFKYVHKITPDVGIRCSTDYGFLTDKPIGLVAPEFKNAPKGYLTVAKPFEEWTNDVIYKVVCRVYPEVCDIIRKNVELSFGDQFEYSTSSTDFYELNYRGCTKAEGIAFLRELYSKEGKEAYIYAIGDYENDMQMLGAADFAACPENALDAVKAICDKTFGVCRDGAVADLIEYIDASTDKTAEGK